MCNKSTVVLTRSALASLTATVAALVSVAATAGQPAPRAAELQAPGAPEQPALEASLGLLLEQTLAANLEIVGAEATVAERFAEIAEARARFRPALDLSARYSRADGGRTIDVPIGDLLNPVYATLNRVDGTSFTPIENQRIELLRSREQDTRLTLTQPIHDPRLAPALDASRGFHRSAASGLDALRARVIRDVKQGYYAWLAARDALAILDSSLELARANLRSNQSLFDNGRITRDLVLRAETDLLELEQQRRAAESAVTLAAGYVNVLRRAPLDRALPVAAIDPDSPGRFRARLMRRLDGAPLALEPLIARAIAERPELAELDAALDASAAQEALAQAARKPRVTFALDAGSQGEDYGLGDDDQFVLASVVMQFSAFNGGANRARVRASQAASDALTARREHTALSIGLDVQRALEQLEVADASLGTAAQRVAAAEDAFLIVSRKRDLGQINQTEFIDARDALTDAQLNLSRTRAAALARLAELEYTIGLRGEVN